MPMQKKLTVAAVLVGALLLAGCGDKKPADAPAAAPAATAPAPAPAATAPAPAPAAAPSAD